MELQNPVVAYNAANNVEAQVVTMLLIDAGVDAVVSEDLSPGGLWMFGILPEIHRPQVWVSTRDVDRAQRVLQDYERRVAERNHPSGQNESDSRPAIEVLCDECNAKLFFPSAQRGTVQDCPRCGAYVDVGQIDEGDPFWLEDDEPEE